MCNTFTTLNCTYVYIIFTFNLSLFSVISYISVRNVWIPIRCKTLHFIYVTVSPAGTTIEIPCVVLPQCHFSPFSNEQGFPEVRRGNGCAFKDPFCLPAEVTSCKVMRACGCCFCYTGQLWFWEEKCLVKIENARAFVLLLPPPRGTVCQSLFSAQTEIFYTDPIICKCVGLSFINGIPNCC